TPPSYDDVTGICKEVLDEVIGTSSYIHTEAVNWNQKIVELITERLVRLDRPYKFCVCCVIMQLGLGTGLNCSSTCYWDKSSDQAFAYRWENKGVLAVVNVFCISVSSPKA
uniref:Dynein light chain Tctex-type 1 n=1 Tax=Acrobeloides nanus TaxID=290746 RepID=A0A914BWH3_9BILA